MGVRFFADYRLWAMEGHQPELADILEELKMRVAFVVQHKKGAENTIADAISCLPTFGESSFKPDIDIPCFSIDELDESVLQQRDANVIRSGQDVQDYDSDGDDEDFIAERFPYEVLAVTEEGELSPIRIATFAEEQSKDGFY